MVVDEAPLMKEGVAMDNTHLTSGGPEGGEFLAASRF